MRDHGMALPFSAWVFGCIYISLCRLVVRGEVCVESAVTVAERCCPLSSSVYCAFLKAVARRLLETVIDVADDLPVHEVLRVHDGSSRHEVHCRADEIIAVSDPDNVRIRAVRPDHGV